MSDTDGKKPLGLGGTPRSGQVKQSFSHGRTKSVVVETKRKRVVVPKPGHRRGPCSHRRRKPQTGDPSKRPAGISDAEMERRLSALRNAKAREVEDAAKRAQKTSVPAKKSGSASVKRSKPKSARIASAKKRCA